MKHLEFSFRAGDGLQLFARSWAPETPRGLVCLVHGYGEHSGRYDHVGAALAAAGYALVAHDQRGHGRSQGPRGHTPSYARSLDDVERLIATGRVRFPDRPTFLYGHSMGGNMALNYALRHQPALAGVIASSPWLQLYEEPAPALLLVSRLLGAIYPRYSLNQGPYDGGVLSRDPAFDDAFEPDPLTHGIISTRLYLGVTEAAGWALEHADEFPLPLLVQHGTADRLIAFTGSQKFAGRAPAAHTTWKAWSGYYHELHNDIGRDAVINFMIAWLDGRLAEMLT